MVLIIKLISKTFKYFLDFVISGKSSGLELIINVEEYDYMIGPNSGAGIKLVLHGQDEIPVPAEYGQELPTGREGFINVEMSRVCKYLFSTYMLYAKYLYNADKYF